MRRWSNCSIMSGRLSRGMLNEDQREATISASSYAQLNTSLLQLSAAPWSDNTLLPHTVSNCKTSWSRFLPCKLRSLNHERNFESHCLKNVYSAKKTNMCHWPKFKIRWKKMSWLKKMDVIVQLSLTDITVYVVEWTLYTETINVSRFTDLLYQAKNRNATGCST